MITFLSLFKFIISSEYYCAVQGIIVSAQQQQGNHPDLTGALTGERPLHLCNALVGGEEIGAQKQENARRLVQMRVELLLKGVSAGNMVR